MAKSSKRKPAKGKKKKAARKSAKRGAAARKSAARKRGGAKKAKKAKTAKKAAKARKAAAPRRKSGASKKTVRKPPMKTVVTGPVQAAAAVAAADEFEPVYDAPAESAMPSEVDLPAIDAGDDEDDEM